MSKSDARVRNNREGTKTTELAGSVVRRDREG